jgi:hypothetical protein
MAFRDENDALRAQVDHLKEELAFFKGEKKSRIRERDHSGKVKRQLVLLIIGAVLGSLGLAVFCMPVAIVPFAENRVEESSPARIAAMTGYSYRRLHLTATFDATRTVCDRDDYEADSTYSVTRYAVADRAQPTVLYYCSYSCPGDVGELLYDAGSTHGFAGGATSVSREIEATVSVIDEYGNGAYEIPSSRLREYASSVGVPVSDLRVVRIERERPSPLPVLIGMLSFALFVGFLLWASVVLHHVLAKRPVELPRADDTMLRDAGMTLILSLVTCRLYELYWIYASTAQIRRLTGRPDLIPALDVLLTFVTFGLWGLWVVYRNTEAVDEAMGDLGERSTHSQTAIMLIAGSFACGLFHWFLLYKAQEAYNQLAIERSDLSEL